MIVNELQTMIMIHLSHYTYLSTEQLRSLTGRSLSYIRSQIAVLVQRQFVKSFQVVVSAKREPNLYYLTLHGLECLQAHEKALPDTVRIPLSSTVAVIGDYHHRKRLIDVQIAATIFFQKNEIELQLFQRYFDKIGNNRKDKNLESITKIMLDNGQYYSPDGVIITQYNGVQKLFIVELFNDKNTIRVLNSLAKSAKSISIASASSKYSVQTDAIVLSAFTYPSIMQAVIKRLQANQKFSPIKDLFYFGTVEGLTADFTTWKTIDNTLIQFTE